MTSGYGYTNGYGYGYGYGYGGLGLDPLGGHGFDLGREGLLSWAAVGSAGWEELGVVEEVTCGSRGEMWVGAEEGVGVGVDVRTFIAFGVSRARLGEPIACV